MVSTDLAQEYMHFFHCRRARVSLEGCLPLHGVRLVILQKAGQWLWGNGFWPCERRVSTGLISLDTNDVDPFAVLGNPIVQCIQHTP